MQAENQQVAKSAENPVIFAEVNDGYTFRNLIEFLKATNVAGNFVFTPEGIFYSRSDAQETILNEVFIPKCNLTYYIYNTPQPEVVVGMTLSNVRKITKPIGKKDTVRFYMHPNDPLFYIQNVSVTTKALSRSNTNFVKPQQFERVEYDPPEFARGEDDPNCTVPVVDFCRMCTAMNSICSSVTVRGFQRGIIFEGMMEGSVSGRIDRFGVIDTQPAINAVAGPDISGLENINLDKIKMPHGKMPKLVIKSPNDHSINTIRIKISTIKSLAKLNNLSSPNGIIKVYIEKDLATMKLICNIGTYGKLTVYLRDNP
jgi:hypothetical protein